MPENPYTDAAQIGLNEYRKVLENPTVKVGNDAALLYVQVHATLALAYEQHTANLIALWQAGEVEVEGKIHNLSPSALKNISTQIKQRLGL